MCVLIRDDQLILTWLFHDIVKFVS